MKLKDAVTVHDAVTSWTENINSANFTVCVMQTGRKQENINPFATIDWLAYQGAPRDGLTGKVQLQKWWSGTNCADVTFPKVGFEAFSSQRSYFLIVSYLLTREALNKGRVLNPN